MQNKIKTNRKANMLAMAVLAVLMAMAVVFGGVSVMGANAANIGGGGIGGGGIGGGSMLVDEGSATPTLEYDTGYTTRITVTYEVYNNALGGGDGSYTTYIYLPQEVKDFATGFTCATTGSCVWSDSYKRFSFSSTTQPTSTQLSGYLFRCTSTGASLPETPSKAGHTFVGWYLDEALTQPYDGRPITSNTNLYAKFEINRYTVTFDSAGGTAVSSQTIDWNTSPMLTAPTREGYTFLGWYNGSSKYEGAAVTSNLSLTAHWEIKQFTVSFDSAGGSSVASQTVNWNTSPTLTTPVREGYTFLGWYNGSSKYEGAAVTSNFALTAKWEIKKFTVTYNSDGGVYVPEEVVEWNTTASAPTLERTGYTFLGWYNGATKYEGQAVTSDMTLTAKWEAIKYTVTFYVDGEVYETMQVAYGTTFQEAMAANERLFFMNLLNDEGVKISKSMKVTGDVSVPIGNMTKEEKVATWIGNNLWVLYLAGGLVLAGIAATAIASVVAHKRK